MNKRTKASNWLVSLIAVSFATALLGAGARLLADELADAEAAVEKAKQEQARADEEWNSREMARSATREIARSERDRSEDALAKLLAARDACQEKTAAAKPEAEIAEARKLVEQRLDAIRAAAERLVADSLAGDQAAQELLVAENMLRDKMCATRAAERAVLELKAKAVQAAQSENAAAARCAVCGIEALSTWEVQLWAGVQKETAQQIVEMTGHACQIASKVAAAEPDPERKKKLEEFASEQAKRKAAGDELIAKKDAEIQAAVTTVYPLHAAAMGGLKPLAPQCWDYAKARHLLVRAGFGGTPQEVERLHAMGLYQAVDYLVDFYKQPAADASFDAVPSLSEHPFAAKLQNSFLKDRAAADRRSAEGGQFGQLRQWWLKRLVESPRPLQEKLTLFWHGLFAAQYSVVQNSYTVYRQNELFREHAAGNYGALLYGIVHDPAMIRYLDNNNNAKGEPNENLAREIMELFAMGVDQGYTEQDIVQAARALTGYTFDNHTGGFRFNYCQHDTDDKTIFGQKGPWCGDDLVRLILEQSATSRFIAQRLFEYFAFREPGQETVTRLASVLRTSQYEISPMLKNLFLSEEFYSEQAMGRQIKSPVELAVGTLRDLGIQQTTDYARLDSALREMGQELFEPPDVKGWRYGRTWISSNRIFVRYNTVADLVRSVAQPGNRQGVDVVALAECGGCNSADEVVDYLAKACLMRRLDEAKRGELVAHLGQLPPRSDWAKQRDQVNEKLQEVLILLLCTPEHQMS